MSLSRVRRIKRSNFYVLNLKQSTKAFNKEFTPTRECLHVLKYPHHLSPRTLAHQDLEVTMGDTQSSEDTFKKIKIKAQWRGNEITHKSCTSKSKEGTKTHLINPCLSRAARLLSTNSTDDGSSIPTFTLVIPVESNDTTCDARVQKYA